MNKPAMNKPMAFIDLARQRSYLGDNVNRAIQRVLAHGNYIMGPEVRELEHALSTFAGPSMRSPAQMVSMRWV